MKEKKLIWSLFDKLRPIIITKLLNPEVLELPRGRTFFYDGIDSDDESGISPVAQLIIPLNDEDAGILSQEEYYTAQQSKYHNVWYVYSDTVISSSWDGWQENVIITLKTAPRQNYILSFRLVCYGCGDFVSSLRTPISRIMTRL